MLVYRSHSSSRPGAKTASVSRTVISRCDDQRGEVFPVAILFGGVMLTILIGLHVVLVSVATTAVQAAADRGVSSAQAAPIGPSTCGTFGGQYGVVTPESERECQGVVGAWSALIASGSMVGPARPPVVSVNENAGVVGVAAFGIVISPVLGALEVIGYACGPLDLVEGVAPTRADASAC